LHTIKEIVVSVHDEVEALYTAAKARALLQAIEWAGSASNLALQAGYSRYAGTTWLRRGFVPLTSALRLEKIQGFPLSALDLCPDTFFTVRKHKARCPRCRSVINRPNERTGCSPSFNRSTKRPRKKPAPKPRAPGAKRKPKAA